jgi:rod shape-determining protein MreD
MIYCFYVGICICLVILQTVVVPYLPGLNGIYDLLIPFVIYLGLYRPVREGLLLVLFIGFIMDNLSGSPFGLYLTTYCWLFIGVKWIIRYVQVENRFLICLVVAAGVLIENLIFIGTFAVLGSDLRLSAANAGTISIQMLWALITGLFFLMFFKYSQRGLENLMNAIWTRHNGISG